MPGAIFSHTPQIGKTVTPVAAGRPQDPIFVRIAATVKDSVPHARTPSVDHVERAIADMDAETMKAFLTGLGLVVPGNRGLFTVDVSKIVAKSKDGLSGVPDTRIPTMFSKAMREGGSALNRTAISTVAAIALRPLRNTGIKIA